MTRDDRAPSPRRAATHAVLRALPLVAAALAVPRLLDHLGATDLDFAPSELAPGAAGGGARDAAADRALGDGFALSVASAPAGARVLVNGVDVGEAPVVAPVRCAAGDPVQVEVRKPSFRAERRVTICRAGGRVELAIELAADPAP